MPFPSIDQPVYYTKAGTPYLKAPGVAVIAIPNVNFQGMQNFLDGFDPDLNFDDYLADPDDLPPSEALIKTAGQLCYASYGPGRTKNRDAARYLDNLKSSGHGSVFAHANISLAIWGISRSDSHEVVRHAVGVVYSQASQRYISGKVLRFVERPEYQDDPYLHRLFEDHIDEVAAQYEKLAEYLLAKQQAGDPKLRAERKTDMRKRVQQAARSVLPNDTETHMIMTANLRAWRHICEMRANEHAEPEIRRLAYNIYLCLRQVAPLVFDDYDEVKLDDGTYALETPYRKV